MSEASDTRRAFRWSWLRHAVQAAALVLFAAPVLAAGWSLFGTSVGGDDAAATPAQLPFFGSLSSSSIGGLDILDPFGALQVIAASKTFELDWLLAALPVLIVYGLIRGRAFCGWVCPVNLLLEIVDFARRKLRIDVREMPVPRHAKLWIALAVLGLSALTGVPVFEAFSPISAVNKGILFGAVTGVWVLLAIVLTELFWGYRVWCRSLCPLGGFYEALGRFGQVNVRSIPQPAFTATRASMHACPIPRSSSQRSTDATRSCGPATAWPAVRASTPAPRAPCRSPWDAPPSRPPRTARNDPVRPLVHRAASRCTRGRTFRARRLPLYTFSSLCLRA